MARKKKDTSGNQFSLRLKAVLKKAGLSVSEAARRSGIPFSTVQAWTVDTLPADYDAAMTLAEVLGVSFTYLMTGKEQIGNTKASMPDVIDVFDNMGEIFDGYARIRIERLVPKKERKG